MLHKVRNRKEEGFTIIEVLIVLAIAGLILLIVFLAVPALQRNSRNTQRKDDAAHIAGAISDFIANNSGTTLTAGGLTAALSNEKLAIVASPTSVTVATTANLANAATATLPDTVAVFTNATCSGITPVYSPSTRAAVVVYGLEGATKTGCASAS